uniref:4-sulfomuconolactone hydrolase n=1 Tax=Rhizophora mucronata TaxID=61149 RepID=A0A2P2KHS2_RHIMU
MAIRLLRPKPLITVAGVPHYPITSPLLSFTVKVSRAGGLRNRVSAVNMATESIAIPAKIIDSHLHVWASPEEAADRYPYFPGQEPSLNGHVDFLLQCMEEASVDGALIVQPINHKFDHSLVTSVLNKYPSKFVGCCLANPEEDGTGLKQLEQLILKDGYRAVRFNPYLWPANQKMTNEVGNALFSMAGKLGVPVGFMCMKGLNLHISEIQELCTQFPSTVVLLDHLGFCKPPM